MKAKRIVGCSVAFAVTILTLPARADNINGNLWYTTNQGGQNVWTVPYSFTSGVFSLGASSNLASTNGSDGLVFDPTVADRILIAGQSNNNLAQVKATVPGGITGNVTVGAAGQSYHLAVTPGNNTVWTIPNGQGPFISVVNLPFATAGTSFPVIGDDTDVRGVAFIGTQGYYGTATDGSDSKTSGNFGRIDFTGTQFVTTRLATNLPAHGLTYDPFTGNIIISAGTRIGQLAISGNTVTQVGTFFTSSSVNSFDQTSVDGKGHLFGASLLANLLFIDYAATGQIGSSTNFSTKVFLKAGLDDIIPLSGLGGPTPAPNGFIEVCKLSSTTNPVPATGIYNFTVTGSAFSTSQNPVMVPVGECSGAIAVTPGTDGTATIQELPTPGVGILKVTAVGYRPPPLSDQIDLLEGVSSQTGISKVIVVPGDTSVQTLVTYTNYEAPRAQLKICKIAGANVNVGTPFSFAITPSTATIPPVEAGPVAEGGFCRLVDGTFQVGTSVTITETVPAGGSAPGITVNGVGTLSTGCTPSSAAYPCSVVAAIGPGINEVSFTNCIVPGVQVCRTGITGENDGHQAQLEIVNYALVSQQTVAEKQSYVTYRADLLNIGTDVGPMIARLTSLDPSNVRVMGQGTLNFEPAQADSQIASSNTFTILIDPAVPLDFSKLNWTFHSRRSVPRRP